jgi:hypothetical protein
LKPSPQDPAKSTEATVSGNFVKERLIPIRLESGDLMEPSYTKLEDPQPPKR